jgi:raffinose/stachyose/melibiose transport system permease protein
MDRVLGNKKAYCVFVLPSLVIYFILVAVPIFMSGYYSTLKWNGIANQQAEIGLRNYVDLFTNDPAFVRAVLNSFQLALWSVLLQLPIALILALVLARGFKGEKFFRTMYFIPVVISSMVIGQLFLKIYNPDYGMLNIVLRSTGLDSLAQDWLGSENTALICAIVPVVWQFIGYHMLLMYTAIKAVPDDIYEAARIDGSTETTTALRITIPLISPILKVCIIFAVTGSLKFFDLIYILTQGGPYHASEVPGYLMYNLLFTQSRYGYGSAVAVFIVIECLLFYFIMQKFFKTEEITY